MIHSELGHSIIKPFCSIDKEHTEAHLGADLTTLFRDIAYFIGDDIEATCVILTAFNIAFEGTAKVCTGEQLTKENLNKIYGDTDSFTPRPETLNDCAKLIKEIRRKRGKS